MAEEYRISKIREYFIKVLDELIKSKEYSLNINFLDISSQDYSINKLLTESVLKTYLNGTRKAQDTYELVSRRIYSSDEIDNLNNVGFFEKLEEKIFQNNKNKIWPDIKSIVKIKCLNCGGINTTTPNTCVFAIQIRVEYLI